MSAPAIVEDEPPHEFYASLFGKKIIICTTSENDDVVLPPPENEIDTRSNVVDALSSSPSSSSCSCDDDFDGIPSSNNPGLGKTTTIGSIYERARSHPMPPLSSLALTSSNCKGFNLLTRMGWKEEDGGLGKRRQGPLIPIRPHGNQLQRGLGFGTSRKQRAPRCEPHVAKPPVTLSTTRTQRRRLRQQQAEQEAQQLKRARMLLRTDVSEEYQELYGRLYPSR